MFDTLSDRLGSVFDKLKGRGALREQDVRDAMREVRIALLEADVALPVARRFIDAVTEKAVGQEPENGMIVACIPNAQHWSIQAKLSIGDFRYQDGGLMDRTHLRWFTRATIFELFAQAGFQVVAGMPRIFDEPMRNQILPAIRMMAQLAGADPDVATNDSLPLQYIVRSVPVAPSRSNA